MLSTAFLAFEKPLMGRSPFGRVVNTQLPLRFSPMRISIARGDSGTSCVRFVLTISGGMVQSPFRRSTCAHCIVATSLRRWPVNRANLKKASNGLLCASNTGHRILSSPSLRTRSRVIVGAGAGRCAAGDASRMPRSRHQLKNLDRTPRVRLAFAGDFSTISSSRSIRSRRDIS